MAPAPEREEKTDSLMRREVFKKSEILQKRKDIHLVREKGERVENEFFLLNYLKKQENGSPQKPRRVGFAVLGHEVRGSTKRNYLKRRMRAVYQRNKEIFPPGLYLIRAKSLALKLSFNTFKDKLLSLVPLANQGDAEGVAQPPNPYAKI